MIKLSSCMLTMIIEMGSSSGSTVIEFGIFIICRQKFTRVRRM